MRDGKKAEKQVHDSIAGSRLAVGSGARYGNLDVNDENFTISVKATKHKHIKVDLAWMDEAINEGNISGRIPVLIYNNVDGREFVIMTKKDFLTLAKISEVK